MSVQQQLIFRDPHSLFSSTNKSKKTHFFSPFILKKLKNNSWQHYSCWKASSPTFSNRLWGGCRHSKLKHVQHLTAKYHFRLEACFSRDMHTEMHFPFESPTLHKRKKRKKRGNPPKRKASSGPHLRIKKPNSWLFGSQPYVDFTNVILTSCFRSSAVDSESATPCSGDFSFWVGSQSLSRLSLGVSSVVDFSDLTSPAWPSTAVDVGVSGWASGWKRRIQEA